MDKDTCYDNATIQTCSMASFQKQGYWYNMDTTKIHDVK